MSAACVLLGGRMHAHRPVIILSTVHRSPWRTPFAMTPHVDTARKASPGTGQWARFPSSEATQEVTSVRIQRLDPLSGTFANTPSLKETHSNRSRPITRRRRQPDARSRPALGDAGSPPVDSRPPGIVPGEHRLPVPDRFRSPSMVSMHLIPVRRHGTPETPLVSDLVRTHTSPRHASGPQAELAGH